MIPQAKEELVKFIFVNIKNKADVSSCAEKIKETAKKANNLSHFISILRASQITKATNHIGRLKHKVDDLIIVLSDYFNAANECVNDPTVSNWRKIVCLVGVRTINCT